MNKPRVLGEVKAKEDLGLGPMSCLCLYMHDWVRALLQLLHRWPWLGTLESDENGVLRGVLQLGLLSRLLAKNRRSSLGNIWPWMCTNREMVRENWLP
jgi:hypothetical protein